MATSAPFDHDGPTGIAVTRPGSAIAAAVAAARRGSASATVIEVTSGVDASWRTARAPTAPAPRTATFTRASPEVGAGQLPPAATLGRHATAAAQPEDAGDEAGKTEGDERTTQEPHGSSTVAAASRP